MYFYYYSLIILFFYLNLIQVIISISPEYNNLISWIRNNGGFISDKITPDESSEFNRIMLSNKTISKNELISFIPEKIILSSINPLLNSICRRAYGLYHSSDLECITFFMTLDKFNKTSFFKPYYDYLPKFDMGGAPTSFSEKKLKFYEELEFDLYVGISNHKLQNAYNEEVEKILEEKGIKNPFEEFKYNYELVKSRNFARPGSDFFFDLNSCVPFIELLNHDNNYNTDFEFDEKNKGFILKAVRDINLGEELTLSYGNESNINLFVTYGFTLKNNIYKNSMRVKIGEGYYRFYPSESRERNIKDIYSIAKSLKEIYGFEKEKEIVIYNLMLDGLEKKLEKIRLIKEDDINIINIIDELVMSIENYIIILKDLIKVK
jgi:hypothetical protein